MADIFKQQKQFVQKPNRNNFDLSFQNNFSTKIGYLTPLMCQEVMPGDKFQIDSAIGLRAMPLAFPVQTPLQCHISYFFVPNRILWDSWKDFISDTQEHEHPYISIPYTRADEIGTGTLADFLGVPTTYANTSGTIRQYFNLNGLSRIPVTSTLQINGQAVVTTEDEHSVIDYSDDLSHTIPTSSVDPQFVITPFTYRINNSDFISNNSDTFQSIPLSTLLRSQTASNTIHHSIGVFVKGVSAPSNGLFQFIGVPPSYFSALPRTNCKVIFSAVDELNDTYENSVLFGRLYDMSLTDNNGVVQGTINDPLPTSFPSQYYITFLLDNGVDDSNLINLFGTGVNVSLSVVQTVDVSATQNPFVVQSGETLPAIKLNALQFRAYEAIYNSYYRNHNDIDPFILNNQKQYNRFVTNNSDGADSTTPLHLRKVNYELDYLTSCLLTPQFGDAPLVGVSSTGTFTFEDEQGQTFKVIPKIGDDGNTLTGIDAYTDGTPIGSLQRLNNAIKYGISISDFRNVNSLQRFLENHLRRGLKYEQVVKSHFGTDMRYTAVDEPQFLGGYTRTINVTQINATAQSDGIKLGDYVGQAGLFDKQKHKVNHYCDEHGFIMCLMSIVPIPTYSQLLPKQFLKDNLLSYPFPLEFRHIGLQPIDYREVTPIQANLYNKDFSDTFGYQRPYYDLIANVDQIHSLFRTSLQGYVFTRNFVEPPALGRKFITVDPAEMTNPFVDVSSDADTFLGQISFDIKAKRPLARIHTMGLE